MEVFDERAILTTSVRYKICANLVPHSEAIGSSSLNVMARRPTGEGSNQP